MSKERGENSGLVDHYFSEIVTDACEDPETFLENLFRSFAALHLRAVPIEVSAIRLFIPGTNFFKTKTDDMFVPTLILLVDAVPQLEDDNHNTMVQYFPYDKSRTNVLAQQCRKLLVSEDERGAMEVHLSEETGDCGWFALRALYPIEEGDHLYLRGVPKLGDTAKELMTVRVMEANRLMNGD
ncbi:hypothetical protein TraAM80_06886 [Trypanosoma rangeli]|uniref:Uncharacterized protein n=1 Tax=Trypanosoma rangeli TaxID=5698 RepID=A0A3R7N7I9_TRYRA|nr:uncharacterized protein TraAM80_06886 [Trypanosoma rangeli]RNF01586.1 hypothetical protein TraAM80_06886 [Trypanosoma rangeli]|eukprot:RNF01586.1 hypothetical protein TraAM80_06886 [Trypanosoma rangeli]